MKHHFELKDPDKSLSPYTRLNRKHWIDIGKHILKGTFRHAKSPDHALFLPKMPGSSYPQHGNENAPRHIRSAAVFEAMARTFNVAAPLISLEPDIEFNNINLKQFYKRHFLELLTNDESEFFIGRAYDYDRHVQQTCELGNLALWSILLPEVFWDCLDKKQKDDIAITFQQWSQGWTLSHNWRWFNLMMMTFLAINGYDYDRKLMETHLDNVILHHAGDGWYRDCGYDYYTMHVYHLYGSIWSSRFGRQHFPARAALIDKYFKQFMTNYPMIFSKNGHVMMYGRSILYRLGASAALPAAFLGGYDTIEPGYARRLASGSLKQFVMHPDFFHNGLPSLGFYGPFDKCIQSYSCSASPYWMFMNFTALTLDQSHPFWSEPEQLGHWKDFNKGHNTKFLKGPGLLLTNHANTGASEIRPSKIHNRNKNYCRLSYNTDFPWEADNLKGPISSSVTMECKNLDDPILPEYIDLAKCDEKVLYRQAKFTDLSISPYADMATIIIPDGEIQIVRLRKARQTKFYLGHFSMPHIKDQKPEIERFLLDSKECITVQIEGRKLAMTNIAGWDGLDVRENVGLHPEADCSSLIYAHRTDFERKYGPVDILIAVLLHKTDNEKWDKDQLNPIREIRASGGGLPLHLYPFELVLKDNTKYNIDFEYIDGASTRH